MNPATIQLLLDLIPALTSLINEMSNNIQMATSSGVTEAQLAKLVSVVSSLTTTTTTALNTAAKIAEQNSANSATNAAG